MDQNTGDIVAILYTDVVGYAHVSDPERTVPIAYDEQTRNLVQSLTQQHGGNWLQALGDAAVCTFGSGVAAMQCAMEIQQRMAEECEIRPRIGIHAGDVVFQPTDVGTNEFFDAVNIAARVQALADHGGICITGRAHEELRSNQALLDFDDLGEVTLDDVDTPIQVHRIKLPASPVELSDFSPVRERPAERRSLLPMVVVGVAVLLAVAVAWLLTSSSPDEGELLSDATLDSGQDSAPDAVLDAALDAAPDSVLDPALEDAQVSDSSLDGSAVPEISLDAQQAAAFSAVRERLRSLHVNTAVGSAGRSDFSPRVWTIPDPVKDNSLYHIGIEANCNCNVLLFAIDGSADVISLLYPNPFDSEGSIQSGGVIKVPSSEQWMLRAVGGEGIDEIVLLVVDSPIEFGLSSDEAWSATPDEPERAAELETLLEAIETLGWDGAAAPLQIIPE